MYMPTMVKFKIGTGWSQRGENLLALNIFLTFCFANLFRGVLSVDGPSSCSGNISEGEFIFLENLYNSTVGTDWRWNRLLPTSSIWHFPSFLSSPCGDSWQGLTCSNQTGSTNCTIKAIILPAANLQGTLPSSIDRLPNLAVLNLQYNKLSGKIPPSLGTLSNIEVLMAAL